MIVRMILRTTALAGLLFTLTSVTTVWANAGSERLYSQGLVEFHKAAYVSALELFDRAVRADADDNEARYWHGVTLAKLDRFSEAVGELETVLTNEPERRLAALELGYALFQLGEHKKAATYFESAREDPTLNGRASLLLGLTQLRRGLDDPAARNFERAARADAELQVSATYYLGVTQYRLGRLDSADSSFRYVTANDADSPLAARAREFLSKLDAADYKRTSLYASVGIEYDSNVILDPTNDNGLFAAAGKRADGRLNVTAGGRYSAVRTNALSLVAGYEFYQSTHFSLNSFDIQNHRVSLDAATRGLGNVTLGLTARYDYFFRELENFLSEPSVLPWLRVEQPGFGHSDLFYRWQLHRFQESPFDTLSDGMNHAVGVRQTFYVDGKRRNVFIGYRFDIEDARNTEGDPFTYDGHQVQAGASWQLDDRTRAYGQYTFGLEKYDDTSGGVGPISGLTLPTREDNRHDIAVGLSHHVSEHAWLKAGYSTTINDSNQEAEGFEYDRHLAQVGLDFRY